MPELYTKGQRNGGFNVKVYLGWIFMASCETMAIYFCMLGLYGQAIFAGDQSIYPLGTLTYTSVVILISFKLQGLEMHAKTYTAAFSAFCSVGGWFLWCAILASSYAGTKPIYYVKNALWEHGRFGRSALWWLTLLMILASLFVFEVGVRTVRAAFWTTDVDQFQELERDPAIVRRFEDAAERELGQGWEMFGRDGRGGGGAGEGKKRGLKWGLGGKGKKKEVEEGEVAAAAAEVGVDEEMVIGERVARQRTVEEQERREGEVRDLLRNRPEEAAHSGEEEEGRKPRASEEIQEMLATRFGGVKRSETLR